MFSSYVYKEGTFDAINKKNFFDLFHIRDAYSLVLDYGHFWKPASQLIKLCILTRLLIFAFGVIPEVICQAKAFKFGSVGSLSTLININPGFCDNG